MSKPKIALIIGSTRKTRFADIPALWMLAQAQQRDDMSVELVDLRESVDAIVGCPRCGVAEENRGI